MKKFIYLLLFIFAFFISSTVNAEVNYTFASGNYHVVYIKDNGKETPCNNVSTVTYDESNIELIKSFDIYDDAVNYMNTLSSTESKVVSIIGLRKDTSGQLVNKIINSQYALVDLNTTNTTLTTSYVYTSPTNNSVYTYINGHGMFGGVDAAFINYNNGTTKAQMKISGVTGWINSLLSLGDTKYNGYEIVPISVVRSSSYYYVSDTGNLIHAYARKISADNCTNSGVNLGPAPSSLKSKDIEGNQIYYYSYDGNYFYDNMMSMLDDYKKGVLDKAVNIIPYYNYYMYSPVRLDSKISADTIKAFLESHGYTSKEKSALFGEELTFLDAQAKYAVNAGISYATAINESGWGTSALARSKNNLFGHNAYDSSVMTSASGYNTVADGIYRHAYYYINTSFVETKDAVGRYFGSHLGNKNSGINVKYASDPYWGEKIAAIYRSLDDYADYKDLNSSIIGIKVSDYDAPVKKEASNSSKTLYKLESYNYSVTNMPVVVLDKVVGENIEGNDVWYKIQTDALFDDNYDPIQDSNKDNLYDREKNIGYVHSSFITLRDENVRDIYLKKEGLFGLEEISVNEDKTVKIVGYLAIKGINNDKNINAKYDLILKNQNTGEEIVKSLDRIMDSSKMPYTIPNMDSYSNEYSWFNGNVNLSDVAEGDYSLYVRARSGQYEAVEILSNMLSSKITGKFTNNNKGYQFRTNYYLKTVPVELFIRNNGLISDKNTPTIDNMFNQYQDISLTEGKLNIKGTSFNVGGNYSTSTNVERKIIFENINTFERFEYNLGYIDNGDYEVKLIVPDNMDKTRAWFNNSIDISNLEKGTYAIYIRSITNVDDYGELNDIFNSKIDSTMVVGDKTYSISVNQNKRFRLELSVK